MAQALVAFCLLLVVLVQAAPGRAAEGGSFFDGFDRLDRGRWLISDGWANGDWQNCLWSGRAVAVADGRLTLTFAAGKTAHHDYTCGEIQTRQAFGHGTYEARIRTGSGSGLNAAFFSYIGPQQGQRHDEIDVEILLRDTGRVSLNTYADGDPAYGATAALEPAAAAGFNTYAFQWEPDRIMWFVNGKPVHTAQGPSGLPEVPQRIFASLWGSGTLTDWMGRFDPPAAPVTMEIDWIAFTSAGEGCRFEASVLCGGS